MFAKSVKTTVVACAAALFFAGFSQTGCDCGGDDSVFGGGGNNDGGGTEGGVAPPPLGGDGGGRDSGVLEGTLAIAPASATIAVTIVNGVVSVNKPVTFSATVDGQPTGGVTWSVDRGELGSITSGGVFTASGTAVGDGTIFATIGNRQATAKVTVTIQNEQNGGMNMSADAGAGGVGGVGGEPNGGAVAGPIVTRLENDSNADPSLKYLYPYDSTVFPRGILAPLVMWDTTNTATALLIQIKQANFSFEGTYDVSSQTGDATKRVHIDDAAWTAATNGNAGDPMQITVKIYSASTDTVYGPITETLKVAPGILTGTVYYNSYDSHLTGTVPTINRPLGGVIAIQPRSPAPTLAVPAMAGKCHVCHTLSADGSSLFAQDGDLDFNNPTPQGDYRNGASYDLTKGGARNEVSSLEPDGGVSSQDREFVWAAPYPDGSKLVTSYGYTRESYLGDWLGGTFLPSSQLVAKADGSVITSNLSSLVTSAVTPTFSPDGRKLAFNFWAGPGAAGVTAGNGSTLAVLDFSCGAPAGSVTCANGATPTFANLRTIYTTPSQSAQGPFVAWPSFTPDGKAVIFHQTTNDSDGFAPYGPTSANRAGRYNNVLSTWEGQQAELWIANDDGSKTGIRLNALNGRDATGASYLPTSANHPDDTTLNYIPTVNPVASGGYYWVVFESRRKYGNLLDAIPFGLDGQHCPPPDSDGLTGPGYSCDYGSKQKKLWVAAIDQVTGKVDPSHPAFYLPGQELDAGNSRGFWVVDPCKSDGSSCQTGDQCCNGYCRAAGAGGALICQKPATPTCSQEFEKCTADADCCTYPTDICIGNRCAKKGIGLPR